MTTHEPTFESERSDRFPAVNWASGELYGVATTCDFDDPQSSVWVTMTDGAIVQTRFPRVDVMNLRTLSFVVTDGDGYVRRTDRPTQRHDDSLERTVSLTTENALAYEHRFEETAEDHDWTLTVETVPDPATDSFCCGLEFEAKAAYDVYVVGQPAPASRAAHTDAQCVTTDGKDGLAVFDTGKGETVIHDEVGETYEIALALEAADGFDWTGITEDGAVGTEPLEGDDVCEHAMGVVSISGRVATDVCDFETTVAVGFATDRDVDLARAKARETLERPFDSVRASYVDSWQGYLESIAVPESVRADHDLRVQYDVAAMVLKAVEDKSFAGAGLASPSVPWGTGVDAVEADDYGYNFVWSRDLYQVATAFDAMGDAQSAIDATEYLFQSQLEDDGFLPQNTFLEGTVRWDGEQLDNISYPLVMAAQIAERHGYDLEKASYGYEEIRRIADYIVRSGPASEQERWEEEAGYSPSTIAAEIAGLVCAAEFATSVGEDADARRYLAVADDWARGVERWCVTETGAHEHTNTPYYVRVSADGRPDEPTERTLANGGPTLDERAILDAGFLELVRLGIKPWNDPTIRRSLAEVDETIRVDTPHGPAWYRYNGDGYGEQTAADPDGNGAPWSLTHAGKGRLWPIFTGERGEYELLVNDAPEVVDDAPEDEIRARGEALEPEDLLETMAQFANSGRMLPEQVWDETTPTAFDWEFGSGTAAATPLAWSCAQYVRLAHSIDAGEPVETPAVVKEFFVGRDDEREVNGPTLADVALENGILEGRTDGEYVLVQTDSNEAPLETAVNETGRFSLGVPEEVDRLRIVALEAGATLWDLRTATIVLD
ncbi:glycoside hydrolase family 15 protein [Halobacteria archaeon AArc-curdl1]|uniref:Glycoside hydrolase family 15 protein n=1 Tax=Natronosalvus hydrolyticus TaxID=2979988 RepID=A0AAP3E551_9EURY|nr:glycoside hydrolase family 15 protein [Halobacteria archaeon AArc-curdl1]